MTNDSTKYFQDKFPCPRYLFGTKPVYKYLTENLLAGLGLHVVGFGCGGGHSIQALVDNQLTDLPVWERYRLCEVLGESSNSHVLTGRKMNEGTSV